MKNSEGRIVVLRRGDDFLGSLRAYLQKESITNAFFTGLGGFQEAEIAFYDLTEKEYVKKVFDDGPYEVPSITGTVAPDEKGKLMVHCHVTMGKRDYTLFGGHLVRAVVGGTLELMLQPLSQELTRKRDKETGLHLLEEK